MRAHKRGQVWILDDEKNMGVVLSAMLETESFEVRTFTKGSDLILALHQDGEQCDAILTDILMPEMDGFAVLDEIKKQIQGLPVILMTAYGTMERAVKALKAGAFDFVTKPVDLPELSRSLDKAILTRKFAKGAPRSSEDFLAFFAGAHQTYFEEQTQVMAKSAPRSPSWITGEPGTGKEILARRIHELRGMGEFQTIHCKAIAQGYQDAEIFGFERGVYSGTTGSKPGKIELCEGGVLFLEDASSLDLQAQARVLRYLQTGEFERVGGLQTRRSDVKLIFESSRDLEESVLEGQFLNELWIRIKAQKLETIPLRDRLEDLPRLCEVTLGEDAISQEMIRLYSQYAWPGNVAELRSALEIKSAGKTPTFANAVNLGEYKEVGLVEVVKKSAQALERSLIERALDETEGNITHAADRLRLSRKGLQNKMRDLGIKRSVTYDQN